MVSTREIRLLNRSQREGQTRHGPLREIVRYTEALGSSSVSPEPSFELQTSKVVSRPLQGLYYDHGRKQVIYRNGTAGIVCAEDSSSSGVASLKDTGQCRLRVSSETRKVEDGFNGGGEETVSRVVFEAGRVSPPASSSS